MNTRTHTARSYTQTHKWTALLWLCTIRSTADLATSSYFVQTCMCLLRSRKRNGDYFVTLIKWYSFKSVHCNSSPKHTESNFNLRNKLSQVFFIKRRKIETLTKWQAANRWSWIWNCWKKHFQRSTNVSKSLKRPPIN